MKESFSGWLRTKRGRRVTWAAIAVAVYALVGFLVVPWVLGKVIPKQAEKLLQREVTIEKIRVNPFALSASFQGVMVRDLDGSPLLSWDEVYGNFQLSSIVHWAFTFREIRVVKPYAHLQVNPDYTLNVSDILQRLEEEAQHAPADKAPRTPSLRVDRIVITNAVAKLSDLTLREPFHRQIGPVDLTMRDFYTHPKNENPYSVEGSTEAGERFEWSGRFGLAPLRSDGQLKIESVPIPAYEPFYRDFVSLKITDGIIDLSGAYDVSYDGTNAMLTVSNMTFHLSDLKVSGATDAGRSTLEVGDLKVSDIEADLRRRRARVGSIALNGGELLVRRDQDASINLVEMSQPSTTNVEPAGAILYAMQAATNLISEFLTTTNLAVAVVDNLDIRDWALQLEDDIPMRHVNLRLDQINVSGKNLSNIPGEDLSLGVECRWNTNGMVRVDVNARLFPIHSDVRLTVDHIELPPLDPYVEPFASVLLLDSKFSMDGLVEIRRQAIGAPFDLDFKGNLSLDDFASVDGFMGTELLAWQSVQLTDVQANLHPMEIDVGRITVRDARTKLVVETNRTINILNAMTPAASNAATGIVGLEHAVESNENNGLAGQGEPAVPPAFGLPPIAVSSVLISNAAVEVRDLSTDPPLDWSVTEVNGEIGRLSTKSPERADLALTANAGGTAPVTITGKLNPLNPDVDTEIAVSLEGMDLLPFTPYSGRYAGYRLRKGSLSLELHYNVNGRKLAADNRIVVDQLSLGEKVESTEATKLPVKLGIAILKDRNGVIELDVPVEGDLDDPEFRLGRVIGRTVMITLTTLLSSPFSLLGGLVGGTGEELSQFHFDPGSSTIPLTETNGLQKLSRALYERPALEVEVQGSVSLESDGMAIRKQKLTRQLQQLRWEELRDAARADTRPEDIVMSSDIRLAMLRKYYVQVFPEEARSSKPPPGLEETFYERMTRKLLDQIEATDVDFRRLASARAQVVKAYLIQEGAVESQRVFLTEGDESVAREGSLALIQLQ